MAPRKAIFLNVLVLALIISTRIFLCFAAGPYDVTVEDISQDKYLPRVKEALINAKSSIDMAMYFVNFNPNVRKSLVNELVEELINAHKKIILSPDNKDFKDIVLENVSGDDFRVVAEFIKVLK